MRGVRKIAARMNDRGVTLVELLTAVSISVIVLGAAVSLVYGLFSMFHKTTDDFELKSEANRIVNTLMSSSANAAAATIKTGEILFAEESNLHRFYVDSTQSVLSYDKIVGSQTDTFSLSQHVSSVKITAENINGVELASIPPAGSIPPIKGSDPNPLIKFEITLQDGNREHRFNVTVKLLNAIKPTLPPS